MTKIIASVSKKVPVPGVAFSNQRFGGSLEVEVPDGITDERLQARLQELYALLGQTVEGEIVAAVEATRNNPPVTNPTHNRQGENENRGGEFRNERRGWSGQRQYGSG